MSLKLLEIHTYCVTANFTIMNNNEQAFTEFINIHYHIKKKMLCVTGINAILK